jgi:hypothetical protein
MSTITEVPTLRWHRQQMLGGLRYYYEALDSRGYKIGRVNRTWQQGSSAATPATQVFEATAFGQPVGSFATAQEAQEAIEKLLQTISSVPLDNKNR